MNDPQILHVYGQPAHHDDVAIVGTPAALRHLMAVIENALHFGRGFTAAGETVFVNDGEGFGIRVVRLDPGDPQLDQLAVPYTREYAQERNEDALWL